MSGWPRLTHPVWLVLFGFAAVGAFALSIINVVTRDWLGAVSMAFFCLLESYMLARVILERRQKVGPTRSP